MKQICLTAFATTISAAAHAVAEERPPNLVVIMADDLGYADLVSRRSDNRPARRRDHAGGCIGRGRLHQRVDRHVAFREPSDAASAATDLDDLDKKRIAWDKRLIPPVFQGLPWKKKGLKK